MYLKHFLASELLYESAFSFTFQIFEKIKKLNSCNVYSNECIGLHKWKESKVEYIMI